jgi:hypothetical protein
LIYYKLLFKITWRITMNINKLIEENLFLAKKIASDRKKSVPKFVDFEELQSAAYLGLVEAANRFDENRGIEDGAGGHGIRGAPLLDHQGRRFRPGSGGHQRCHGRIHGPLIPDPCPSRPGRLHWSDRVGLSTVD